MNFLPRMDKVRFGGGASEHKITFCLKWSKRVQMGPKGSQIVKNTSVDYFGPFWTLWDHFRTLTSLPCLAILGPKWTILSHPQSCVVGPKVKIRLITRSPLCGLLVERTPKHSFWNINMAAIYEKCQKKGQNSIKNGHFSPLSCHEWQIMGPTHI